MNLEECKKPYFQIWVDYEGCLGNFSVDSCSYGCEDDTLILDGYEDTPFVVPGIEEWCYEWNEFNVRLNGGETMPFDWTDWQLRGLDFAQKLRQIVPDDIEIIYSNWGDNILLKRIRQFQILPAFGYEIGDYDCEATTVDKDDLLRIGWFKPIHTQGIYQWWKDYDLHVTYDDDTADPEFDWATWFTHGLELAKELRTKLHPTVALWFRSPLELREIFPTRDLIVGMDGSCKIGNYQRDK